MPWWELAQIGDRVVSIPTGIHGTILSITRNMLQEVEFIVEMDEPRTGMTTTILTAPPDHFTPVEFIPVGAGDWKPTPHELAEVLCSDGEWRVAEYRFNPNMTQGGAWVWVFSDGSLRMAETSKARSLLPPPIGDPEALERWLDS